MIRILNAAVLPAAFMLAILEGLLLLGAFAAATVVVGDFDPADYLLHDWGLIALAVVTMSFLIGMHFQDLYTQIRVGSRVLLLQQLCMVTGGAFLAQGLISYVDGDLRVPVRVMLLGSVVAAPSIFLERLVFSTFGRWMIPQSRLVLIGSDPTLDQLRRWIEKQPDAGLVVERSAETLDEGAWEEITRKQQPPQVVLGASKEAEPETAGRMLELRLAGCDVQTAATAYERASGRVSIYSLRPEQLIFSPYAMPPERSLYQHLRDGLLAGVCLLAGIPALILTMALLRALNGGPVWCRESLTGMHGRVFRGYRLRTGGPRALTRFVRKFRLDTFPRFLNVLQGDLAIVGPRPERPEFEQALERLIPFYRERQSVRPGITGWAQVHLDRQPEIEDSLAKLEYDLYYIKNRSLGLDTLILLHTVKSMLMLSPGRPSPWENAEASLGDA